MCGIVGRFNFRTGAPVDSTIKQITEVLKNPEVRDLLFSQGLDPAPTTPEEFGNYIRSEIRKWSTIVRESGAKSS